VALVLVLLLLLVTLLRAAPPLLQLTVVLSLPSQTPLLLVVLLLREACRCCCGQLCTLSDACLPAGAACKRCCRGLLWRGRMMLPCLHSTPQHSIQQTCLINDKGATYRACSGFV
jgi:hypothetical protein